MSLRISHLLPSILSSLVGFSLKRNTHSSIRQDLAIRRITPRPQGKKVNFWLTLHARSPRRVNFRQREGAENLPFPGNSCTGTGCPHAFRHNERDNDVTEPSATRPEGVQLRARRSPRLIALGVLLIVLGALGAAALYTTATGHRQAVAMANDVTRGQEIRPSDLTVRELPGDQEGGLDPREVDDLIGKQALFDLPAGSFPAKRHVAARSFPEGNVTIGLKLGPGRMPNAPLVPGQRIQLVDLKEGVLMAEAVVAALPEKLPDGATWLLDISLPADKAPLMATRAAADQVALFVLQES